MTIQGIKITKQEIDNLYERLSQEAESSAYHLNPDIEFTKDLLEGILKNEKRYGYWSCPCRLATGNKKKDLDIICPCNYRDADLNEYGMCYCALYVSEEVLKGNKKVKSIPERRLQIELRQNKNNATKFDNKSISIPVWRCQVCGYLCGREKPPDRCPICKAERDRFERFL